jgi:hypothetical protein
MKGVNVAEVFCEVLSGLAVMFFVIPLLDIIGTSSISSIFPFMCKNLSATTIGGALVLAYILGLLMDAIGLAVGEWFLDSLLCKDYPSIEETAAFWKSVSSHVLGYRDTQWAYASAYRNLAILTVPGGLLWCWCVGNNYGWILGITALTGMIFIEVALLKSLSVLLRIYVAITKVS